MLDYRPKPVDTAAVVVPKELGDLIESLAENTHEIWAEQRMRDGWTYGAARDDLAKKHPCLVPYGQLPDSEKQYDRRTAEGILRLVLALGYRILPPGGDGST